MLFRKKCPRCGAENAKENTSCAECGAHFHLGQAGGQSTPVLELKIMGEPGGTISDREHTERESPESKGEKRPTSTSSGKTPTVRITGYGEEWLLAPHLLLFDYLQKKEVHAEYVEPATSDTPPWPPRKIRLTGQNIDEIQLTPGKREIGTEGMDYSPGKVRLRVLLDKPLPKEAKKTVAVKSKVTKENKIWGVFGGTIVDVKWVGGCIADSLNQDVDLRSMHVGTKEGVDYIKIRPRGVSVLDIFEYIRMRSKGKSAVDISVALEHPLTPSDLRIIANHFSNYDRIAEHVREFAAMS
jgi:hypothetical protein